MSPARPLLARPRPSPPDDAEARTPTRPAVATPWPPGYAKACERARTCAYAYPEAMSELPLDDEPGISAAARDAARGHVVYLTEHGERLAAIVPAEFAAVLEGMTQEQARELVEDLADADAARRALDEPTDDIPADQVWTELGLS